MYRQLCAGSLITCVRDKRIWNYELRIDQNLLFSHRNLWIVQTLSGSKVAYANLPTYPGAEIVRELEVAPGYSVRAITFFIARQLIAEVQQGDPDRRPLSGITFKLGANQPVYEALDGELSRPRPSYAW